MSVFISYVREDSGVAKQLAQVLRQNGVDVWIDRDEIKPGVRWKDAISTAIESGDSFVALFSRNHVSKAASYANEEIIQAIEIFRRMPRDRQWFFPVKIDDCSVPKTPIGLGETLHDLNWVSLGDEYVAGMRSLLLALGVENPTVGIGEPLAQGFSSILQFTSGRIIYENCSLPNAVLEGLIFHVSGGWCVRNDDGHIAAQIVTGAPSLPLEEINVMFGLNQFFAVSQKPNIKLSEGCFERFEMSRSYNLPKGTEIPSIFGQPGITLPVDLPIDMAFVADGVLSGATFKGTFKSEMKFTFGVVTTPVGLDGSFDISFRNGE